MKTYIPIPSQFLKRCFTFIALSIVVLVGGCESYEIVIDELSQKDANIALVLLRSKNIEAEKEAHASKKNQTYQIKVKKSQADNALRLLVLNQIPRENRAQLKDVYPPGTAGLMPTKSDEFARLVMAMQGEIEALLKVVPGIADAKVVFSFDSPMEINKTLSKRSASVAVVYRPDGESSAPPLSDDEIKNLIGKSIAGLNPEDVTVVQKMISSAEYMDAPAIRDAETTAHVKAPEPATGASPWYLMALTIVALLIAAYGAFRIYLQKRIPA